MDTIMSTVDVELLMKSKSCCKVDAAARWERKPTQLRSVPDLSICILWVVHGAGLDDNVHCLPLHAIQMQTNRYEAPSKHRQQEKYE